jgi:biotin operon repressor
MFWKEKKEEHHRKFETHMHIASRWINHLHDTDRAHHRRHNEIVSYLHQMHNFVSHLKKENEELKQEIQKIKENTTSKHEIMHLVNQKEIHLDTKPIETAILERLKLEIPKQEQVVIEKKIEKPIKITENFEKQTKSETLVPEKPIQDFTFSEKEVLNVLFSADAPLSYEAIGVRLNKKSGTIKVYVNDLKKKGIDLEELNGPGNIKLYAITNKEKVKKLYNFSFN